MADRTDEKANGRKGESRRGFMKKAALGMGAALTANLSWILQGKAQAAAEKDLINRAAEIVQENARRGLSGSEISLTAQYKELGGASQQVLEVLGHVERRLTNLGAFREFAPELIDRGVAEGIQNYARQNMGAVADKSAQFRNPDSAARVMFERGGRPLKNLLEERNVQVPGFTEGGPGPRVQPDIQPGQPDIRPGQPSLPGGQTLQPGDQPVVLPRK